MGGKSLRKEELNPDLAWEAVPWGGGGLMKYREAFWWYIGIIERLVSMDGKDGMLCMGIQLWNVS